MTEMETRTPSKTKPIPVRLDKDTRTRVDAAAKKMASNRAAIIRLAIVLLLPDIEAGKITFKNN